MRLIYIAFARIPTEKAHGFTIAKACESFATLGLDVELWVPKRKTSIEDDVYTAYGLERNFRLTTGKIPDLTRIFRGNRIAFTLHTALFFFATAIKLLFKKRRDTIIYTRDALMLLFAWLGYRVVLECHAISHSKTLYFFLAKRADKIVVISQVLKDSFVASGFSENNILVAPSGVDLSVFDIRLSKQDARTQLNLPQEETLAVYTGNFTTMGEDKGISDILNALQFVPGVIFVAVGGSASDIARYEQEAHDIGVSDRVLFRGHGSQKTLAIYQKAADVLLMPFPDRPHYRDHMSPVKMFEYMASKRPIIATNLPTITEVLNSSNSIIVPPSDLTALSGALQAVKTHPDAFIVQAERAHKAVEQFAWQNRTKRIVSFMP